MQTLFKNCGKEKSFKNNGSRKQSCDNYGSQQEKHVKTMEIIQTSIQKLWKAIKNEARRMEVMQKPLQDNRQSRKHYFKMLEVRENE